MKKMLLAILLFYGLASHAQKITFQYDAAGNQVLRTWCLSCPSRAAQQPVKEISKLDDSDLEKFFPEDVISYYPNPVKEELYLKWDLVDENNVSSIDVFSLNGQLLQSLKQTPSQNSRLLSFGDLPTGVYYVNLNYTNGEQKAIKIIKN